MPARRNETRKKSANSADQLMRHKSLEVLPISKLQPYARNARVHSKKQIRQVADSIRRFGFTNPVLIDNEHTILAGHCRVAAASLLEMDCVPCLRIENMSPAEKRAYVLADNKHALNGGWDEEILAEELQALLADDFDIGITGFSIPEIDGLIEGLKPEEPGDPEDDLLPSDAPARCRPGDLWQLGPHRLVCGDALEPLTVAALMNGERAQWSSPTRHTTCRSKATSAGAERSSIASLPWPQAK